MTGKDLIESLYADFNQPGSPCRLEKLDHSLEIIPSGENTFPIFIQDEWNETAVYACAWHEHFSEAEQAGGCVLGLLSPYYRVVESYVGTRFMKAHIERYEAEGWKQIGTEFGVVDAAGSFKKLLGQRKYLRIYQQAVIRPPFAWTDQFPGAVLDANGLPPGTVLGVREERV